MLLSRRIAECTQHPALTCAALHFSASLVHLVSPAGEEFRLIKRLRHVVPHHFVRPDEFDLELAHQVRARVCLRQKFVRGRAAHALQVFACSVHLGTAR